MHFKRTKLKQEIVCEFLEGETKKVIILCDGMPAVPSKKTVAEYWNQKGYWVFHPRYRGTWESSGEFLRYSPDHDILDVIDALSDGFIDLWSKEEYKLKPEEIILIGSSFGGAVAILASPDKRISKIIALSPVVDWSIHEKTEPLDFLRNFTIQAFGKAYRFSNIHWNRLKKGKFFNPAAYKQYLKGEKIYIVQTEDDPVIDWKEVKKFSNQINASLKLYKKGGHLGLSDSVKNSFVLKQIEKYINGKN